MESAINIPSVTRPTDRRAYLAGSGATAALIAAAVILFIGIAAFVDFNGLPFGSDEAGDATVNLTPDAPLAAAAAASPTAESVAAAPTPLGDAAAAEILASLSVAERATLTSGGPGGPPLGQDDLNGSGPVPGVDNPPPAPATPGALGNTVGRLDDTTSRLGLNLGLGGLTDDLTGPLDKTLNDTVNGLGGALGDPKLGDKVNSTVNGLTNGLLGKGGLLNP